MVLFSFINAVDLTKAVYDKGFGITGLCSKVFHCSSDKSFRGKRVSSETVFTAFSARTADPVSSANNRNPKGL